METLFILAIIGIIFGIGKFSYNQKLISNAFIDYSKPANTIEIFIYGLLVTIIIATGIVVLLLFLSTIL